MSAARVPLALAVIVLGVYGSSLDGSFHYDDFHSIVDNPHIRELGNIPSFFTDPTRFSADADKAMYRPLLLVTYALNYAWSGYDEVAFRLVNLTLHYLCALLVFHLARANGCGSAGALFGAVLFAVHPLATEPVNYISSRSELLGACLYLAAFRWAILDGRRSMTWALLAFALALMSKEMVITLPLVLWCYQRWGGRGNRLPARRYRSLWLVAVAYVLVLTVTGSLGSSLTVIERNRLPERLTEHYATAVVQAGLEHVGTQIKAVALYTRLIFVPTGLNVEQQFSASAPWEGAVLLAASLLASAAVLCWRHLRRDHLFWLAFAAIASAPAVVVPLNVLVNEHRLYLPLAGLSILAARLWEMMGRRVPVQPVAACGVVLVLAVLSIQRSAVWADELTLWSDSAARAPYMVRPHVHLGNALRDRQRVPEAAAAYERALRLEPTHRAARTNLGNLKLERGRAQVDSSRATELFVQAAREYEMVLAADPGFKEALNNLASAHMLLGDLEAAADVLERAVAAHPNFAEAHYNLGSVYARLGRYDEAAHTLEQAVNLSPDAETNWELGNAYARSGRLTDAVAAYRRARAADGTEPRYARNLGSVLQSLGDESWARGDVAVARNFWQEAGSCFRQLLADSDLGDWAARRLEQVDKHLP